MAPNNDGGSADWVRRVRLIDSTFREGLQCARFAPGLDDKRRIARRLAAFGVYIIELVNPVGAEWARGDAAALGALDLGGTRLAAHVRARREDVRVAVDVGVAVLHLFIPSPDRLRRMGRPCAPARLVDAAAEVAAFARMLRADVEVRLTPEDTFRIAPDDRRVIFERLVEADAFDRLGVADTVGAAHPLDVERLVAPLCRAVRVPVGFHGHDDTGCAVANALVAARAGATFIDTSVLGLGERNGITALEGFVAGLLAADADHCAARFRLGLLGELVADVARVAGAPIPPRTCLVGPLAFTHKAGVHVHAVLDDPQCYEFVDPALLDRRRTLLTLHGLTGWHAVRARAARMGVELDEPTARALAGWLRDASADGSISDEGFARRLAEVTRR